MESLLKQVAWLLFGAYAIGLVASQVWAASLGLPIFPSTSLLEVNKVLFGAYAIALILATRYAAISLEETQPLKEAIDSHHDVDSKGPKLLGIVIRFVVNIGSFTLPYFLFMMMVTYWATECNRDDTVSILLILISITLYVFGVLRGLRSGFFSQEEEHDVSSTTARFFNLKQEDVAHLLVVINVIFPSIGIALYTYPRVSQNLGGGKPIVGQVFLDDESKSSSNLESFPATGSAKIWLNASDFAVVSQGDGERSGVVLIKKDGISSIKLDKKSKLSTQPASSSMIATASLGVYRSISKKLETIIGIE